MPKMSFGITKTIPKQDGPETVTGLFDGPPGEYEFHMAGLPSKLKPGDYVYTIFNDQLVGRLKIIRLETGAQNPESGKPRTLIYVRTPGERLAHPVYRKGHRGTRYYDGADWSGGSLA
jgi:hypothetical protein